MRKVIACDIDGCVANLMDEICTRLRQEGHNATYDDFTEYKVENLFPVGDKWLQQHFADPTMWLNAKPYEDAWYMINKWFSEGIDIFFVTGRWHDALEPTIRWLNEWDIPFNDIFTGQSHGMKHEVVNKLGAHVMIEDRLTEADELVKNGVYTYLIDRPWNQEESLAKRVLNMYEIDRRVREVWK